MTQLRRFFTKIRDGKTFAIPFRREVPRVLPPTPAVHSFTSKANSRARAASRARNKRARASRKANR